MAWSVKRQGMMETIAASRLPASHSEGRRGEGDCDLLWDTIRDDFPLLIAALDDALKEADG